MENSSKYLIYATFGWFVVMTPISLFLQIPDKIIQILFAFPISFLTIIAANKSESLEVIKFKETRQMQLRGRLNANKEHCMKFIKEIEKSMTTFYYVQVFSYFSILYI